MIEIKNIDVKLGGSVIVSSFSAMFTPGTITAIIGKNGSGKSTLVSALAGDLPISNGIIRINERDLTSFTLSDLAKWRSVVTQSSDYQLPFTVTEVLEMTYWAGGTKESINSALQALGIWELRKRKVTMLSGGEKQRVAIAFALATTFETLILDEPLSAQDEVSKDRIINLLKELAAAGKTVILVAHLPRAQLTWCDQIIDNLK
jgi:iron complex transport system ATP-binding protein